MKKGFLAGTIVTGILMLVFGFMAAERAVAVSGTNQALDLINQGLDWDGTTAINAEQQHDRMQANLDVLVHERTQRNTWGALALVSGLAAAGLAWMTRKPSLPDAQSVE